MSKAQHNTTASRSLRIVDPPLLAFSALALALIIGFLAHVVPDAFVLRFNGYALISVVGFVLNVALLIILIRRSNQSNSVMWFALFIVFGALWSAVETMERLSGNAIGATFWASMIFGITTFMPVFYYLFVRSYTDKQKTLEGLWVTVILLGVASIMGALLAGNDVFPLPTALDIKPWGFASPNADVTVVFILWAGSLSAAAIGRLVVFSRRSTDTRERRLAAIFIASSVGLIVLSGLSEVLLPTLGVQWFPPLGVFSNVLLALGVLFGIYKYGSFAVGADEIADTVLATMTDGVVVTDLGYNVIYRNDSAQRLLSALGRDILGINFRAAYSQRDMGNREKWEHDLKLHGFATTGDIEVGTKDKRVTINLHVAPLQADHPGYIFVLLDVTQIRIASDILQTESVKLSHSNSALKVSQVAMTGLLDDAKKLELALKNEKAGVEHEVQVQTAAAVFERSRLEAALNGLDVGVYMINNKLELVYANKAMEDIYAVLSHGPWSAEGYMNGLKASPDFVKDVDLVQGKHQVIERPEFQAEGRVLRTYEAPILDPDNPTGPAIGSVGSIQDITEAKAIERSRDEFFSIASHELRTPLTAIRGNTSMIQDYYADQIKDPELKGMISDIHDSSIRLITLVNDFLNTSRLEQGKIDFKLTPFSAADLIAEVVSEFKAGNPTTKVPIKFKPTVVPLVLADRDRLKEVLLNLIGNGVKFTDKGSITVGLGTQKHQIKLTVTDTGTGIPLESQNLLFRKFQQASNNILTRDSTRSTGLGLYISKLITIGMGGTIALETSAVGKGSTFAVLLPAAEAVVAKTAPIAGAV